MRNMLIRQTMYSVPVHFFANKQFVNYFKAFNIIITSRIISFLIKGLPNKFFSSYDPLFIKIYLTYISRYTHYFMLLYISYRFRRQYKA